MTTDTTLFEIFSDLGLLEMLQDVEAEQFIEDECAQVLHVQSTEAA